MEPKEKEVKTVDGITRLICLSKGHNTPLKVHIDGSEWSGNEVWFSTHLLQCVTYLD